MPDKRLTMSDIRLFQTSIRPKLFVTSQKRKSVIARFLPQLKISV